MKKNNKATKYDNGKDPLSFVTYESLAGEARAMAYGAKKYGKHNFKSGMDWSRLIDANLRHMFKFKDGVNIDEESKLPHLYLAKANLGMLIYYYERKLGKDDR